MLPAYRPQEFLQLQALAMVAQTARDLSGRTPVDVLVITGDNVDSAQANELDAYLRALDGGTIDPTDLGVGHPASPTGGTDPAYWHPNQARQTCGRRGASRPSRAWSSGPPGRSPARVWGCPG